MSERDAILAGLRAARPGGAAPVPDYAVLEEKRWDPVERTARLRRCMAAVKTEFLEAGFGDWPQAVESYEKICTLLEAPKPAADAPPAGGAPAPAPAGGATSSDDDLLKKAHLYLAIIFADHLKKRDKAKEHARKFVALGGTDQNLQSFIDDLLTDK